MLKKLKHAFIVCGALCSTAITAQAGELNVYNWIEYIPENFKSGFEQETTARVNYDTYDTEEYLDMKLAAGRTGYDVVVPGAAFAEKQIKQGRYQKIDRSLLMRWQNLNPEVMAMLASIDPGNQYLVPWSWGYTGIGVNETAVRKALGAEPMPSDPFELVFNPKYTRKLKSCGIFMLDSPSEILPVALHYLGRVPNSDNAQDYEDVLQQVLKPIRSDIRYFGDSSMISDLEDGKYCVTLAWASDVAMAARRSNNPNIKMLSGKHSMMFVDVMAIPADAQNITTAHQWLDYSMRPEIAAKMLTEMGYATPNQAAESYLSDYTTNEAYFPSASSLANMYLRRLPQTKQGMQAMYQTFRGFKMHGRAKK